MEILFSLPILLFSAILHEVAHGLVADRLGDPTPRLMGRLTLNPKSHIDPFMSIALPLLLMLSGSPLIFGAAKPVPVDPFNLKEGRKDVALVALAGPLTNVLLAICASFLLKALGAFGMIPILSVFLLYVVRINLLLAIINLIPIPPVDGSKVFALILPEKDARIYLSFGSIGIAVLLLFLLFAGNTIHSILFFAESMLLW
ncbi:MAG: hypothetical protein A3J69_01710 [Candidatus Levybacteria bacterium RIFCSPHIGHO2_02_FULL_42_12]|nr:MAG: hypothetical protein A2698_02040 [Candidatus Levybacteria bacterium RIFCSPHIGHO2_01_FULL_42_15]OGH30776.1 MAG: hypothetical protein A3J69_01710 [Candidatus Levybacteria bacterium RIFCSPHIGHO2_02_FULL_42_12]